MQGELQGVERGEGEEAVDACCFVEEEDCDGEVGCCLEREEA